MAPIRLPARDVSEPNQTRGVFDMSIYDLPAPKGYPVANKVPYLPVVIKDLCEQKEERIKVLPIIMQEIKNIVFGER